MDRPRPPGNVLPVMHQGNQMSAYRTLDGLGIRKRLGRADWGAPDEFGPDGWTFVSRVPTDPGRIIVTAWDHDDGHPWIHASISRADRMPDYADLKLLHEAIWPNGYAYQVFVPPSEHVNIHDQALHLWGRADNTPAFPPFDFGGTI